MAACIPTADLVSEESEEIVSVKESRQICIHDLPEEILIVIFSMTSPYRDFKSIMLVCQEWSGIMADVIYYHNKTFYNAVSAGNLKWHCHDQSVGVMSAVGRYSESSSSNVTATVTERYSHSACYYDKSVYVFGGCASTSTTFNDLWRFDLGLRAWIRPLATGSYPSPKACATLTAYKDCLILFGGWSHHSLHIFHQSSKFFNQLHVFHPYNNKWTLIDPSMNGPEGKAGHGATVIGDNMIVFGGYQGLGTSCNDVWVLDLLTMNWTLQETTGAKPSPRYNHTQAAIDDNHILVLGGCGGPNMQLTDAWLLTISLDDAWKWDELNVVNLDQSAPQLMCHQACVVKDKLVVVSKNNKITPPVYIQSCTHPCRLPPQSQVNNATKIKLSTPQAHRDQSGEVSALQNDDALITENDSQGETSKHEDMQGLNVSSGASVHSKRCCPDSSDSDSEDTCTAARPLYSMSPDSGAMLCALTLQNEETRNPESNRIGRPAEVVNVSNAEGGCSTDSAASCSLDMQSVNYVDPDMQSLDRRFSPTNLSEFHCASVRPGVFGYELHTPGRSPSNSRSPFPSAPRQLFSPRGMSSGSRTGQPSIRPNAMNNRQRQLDTLRKYEDRLRARKVNTATASTVQPAGLLVTENVSQRKGKSSSTEGRSTASSANTSKNNESAVKTSLENRCCCDGNADYERYHRTPLHPMFVHTLDLSEAVSWLRVTWLPISVGDSPIQGGDPPPEETIFYSLVEGQGELVLFGGIQGDMATMQRAVSSQTKNVTNALYFLTPPN